MCSSLGDLPCANCLLKSICVLSHFLRNSECFIAGSYALVICVGFARPLIRRDSTVSMEAFHRVSFLMVSLVSSEDDIKFRSCLGKPCQTMDSTQVFWDIKVQVNKGQFL